jgi:hypothetical protein
MSPGTVRGRVPLVEAWAVRFEMAPAWRFTARTGKDDRSLALSGNGAQHFVHRAGACAGASGVGARRSGDGG